MYLAYIDASGRPAKNEEPKDIFVLAALITHESQWSFIDNRIKDIKRKHFPQLSPEEIEFHAKDMLNRERHFKGLNWDEIYSIFDDVFDFLGDANTQICIISVVIWKQKMYPRKDIEKWAYRLLDTDPRLLRDRSRLLN